MLGSIIGDIIGSRFEWHNIKTKEFELFADESRFTDDTIMTIAVADAIMNHKDIVETMTEWGRKYPDAGYGGRFREWLTEPKELQKPYDSWGNGAAMRVGAIAWLFESLEQALEKTRQVTEVTHNHPEGLKGADATVTATFMALHGFSKNEIKQTISHRFDYNLDRKLDEIRPIYQFNESCQETVPEAIIAFLESTSYEDAIRNAISIGGDSDTLACIAGGIAEAYYGETKINPELLLNILDDDIYEIINQFYEKSLYL